MEKYKINLEEDYDAAFENDPIIKALMYAAANAKPGKPESYEKNELQHNKFNIACDLMAIAFPVGGRNCTLKPMITRQGRVGTIGLRTKPVSVKDMTAFKYAISLSDSLEVEARTDGFVDINLTFFDMATRSTDRSKN